MTYKPTFIIDDDNEDVLRNFRWESEKNDVKVVTFKTWDKTKEYLESGKPSDAIVLDARGQVTAGEAEGDHHIMISLEWVKNKKIPYVIYTAHSEEELKFLKHEWKQGKVLEKTGINKSSEEDVFDFLKKEIANSPQMMYPEPFACFGGQYLDFKYQEMLMDVVKTLQNDELNKPENILFNPCRIILENVFRKINEIDERILPYALVDFDNQRARLTNCSKYLNGKEVRIGRDSYSRRNVLNVHISQQIQTIIGVCHPASHEIQNYSTYTFKSVLWALFDVLIWLKDFVDERN